jgi:hypothetical protein
MKPFLHGKKSISIPPLRPLQKSGPAHAPSGNAAKSAPESMSGAGCSVEVLKEGDKVSRIIVTCACGERVEITCLYPAGS